MERCILLLINDKFYFLKGINANTFIIKLKVNTTGGIYICNAGVERPGSVAVCEETAVAIESALVFIVYFACFILFYFIIIVMEILDYAV